MKRKIIVGSRESKLAVVQSMEVVKHLRKVLPEAEIQLLTMKTAGDRILDRTLDQIGGKGLFVRELDKALRDRAADLTVHSLKDMPAELPEDLPLVGWSRRADPRDVLVLPKGRTEPDPSLPIGTASFRRRIQLEALYPGFAVRPVRGNVQTRLRKLDEGEYGALVLAAAGLKRMGLEDRISRYFTVDEMIPAAVLERGTTARQRRIGGTLEGICGKTEVRTPAVIVVGQVCALAEDFAWYEKRPLAGVRVLVTRPKERSAELSGLLRQRGAEVIEAPAIRTVPIADNKTLTDRIHKLEKNGYDWLVFTSPSGVHIFFDALFECSDVRALGGVKIAVIGQGSKDALAEYGVKADHVPSVFDGETLGRELAEILSPDARVLIPRAAIGNRELVEELSKVQGVAIDDIPTYDTLPVTSPVIDETSLLEAGEVDFVVFTSASTVRSFAAGLEPMDLSRVNAVCIGKQTQAAAESFGMRTWTAKQAGIESLADCVEQAAAQRKEEQL